MKLEKAIEILGLRIQSPFARIHPDTNEAMKLGIEALKLLEKRRRFANPDRVNLLPGETKD